MTISPFPLPANEDARISALADFHLMDTPPEEEFDRLAELAARLFKVPTVLISLIGNDRQFFKARVGFDPCETSREISFCAHAIMQDDILFIPDALKDERFAKNALVLGTPFIRFYAGKPLVTPTGEKIGTVCLIDSQPHQTFSAEDRKNLSDIAALVMDRMEMRRLEIARDVSQTRFENIASTSPDAIICYNDREEITFWNRAAEKLFGFTAQEAANRNVQIIVPVSLQPIYQSELQRLRNGEHLALEDGVIELSGLRKDGSEFPSELSLSTWREGNTNSVGIIVRDITERKQNEERLFRLACLDPLTDLPNRAAWRDRLKVTLAAGTPASLLLLDLDRFKEVNDTLGHSAGDAVLREAGARLKAGCPEAIMVARLGGDEFVALLPGNHPQTATEMADRLIDAIGAPYEFAGQRIEIGVSVGIALTPDHSQRDDELLGSADLALYKAKAAGRGRSEMFEKSFREVAIARRAFELELRQAFEHGEFELYYQPQLHTQTGAISGAETLIRWNHPTRGLLSPVSFIDVLSQKPSAPAIGEWILRTACAQAVGWQQSIPNFRIGVNLFEAQLRTGQLSHVVEKALADTGLPAASLELEIVENILLRNDDSTLRLLQELRSLGVGLAFDDYGTGFASLSLLKRYPVTRLKIDRSFIRDVTTDPEDAAVVKAVIYLGRSFGMEVIAEGVETEDQLQFLKKENCAEVQGYLFGKPMRAAALEARFIRTSKVKASSDT